MTKLSIMLSLFILIGGGGVEAFQSIHHPHSRAVRPSFKVALCATSPDDQSKKKIGRKEGVYVRPSAAIERGSGFFIPGLEGPKVRLAGGTVLLVLLAVNHFLSSSIISSGNVFSEALAAAFSILVLVQGLIEYTKENRRESLIVEGRGGSSSGSAAATTTTTVSSSFTQQWLVPVNDAVWKSRVEWSAASFLSLTPADHIALIGPGSIVYWQGSSAPPNGENNNVAKGCQAALDTCLQSKSGRVSLPPSHPTVQSLAPENHQRCVLLQRVDEDSQLVW
eukprot:CAMPEP_0198144408 /NCGR_PEP_ID=MMETSP1443-20131203/15495_1 /TAXON_ID=186043 /ORGANISM="Entomoneis sp., Strain CCMP2396" /LENGTH=278 /DNA_ID=CAMNT_0043807795 /DNA_START=13 /DNA_END=846 /DNA_ORIENTATION=-